MNMMNENILTPPLPSIIAQVSQGVKDVTLVC